MSSPDCHINDLLTSSGYGHLIETEGTVVMNISAPVTTWSPQQANFLRWAESGRGSCVLEAVAGAGKTTTILEAVERMDGQVAILAYNNKIAAEIKGKIAARGLDYTKCQAGTVHSFGFAAYRKQFKDVKEPTDQKVADILDHMIVTSTTGLGVIVAPYVKNVAQMVSLAKQRAIGVIGQIMDRSLWHDIVTHFDIFEFEEDEQQYADEIIEASITAAQKALIISNRTTDLIDFDDMVYLPLIHHVKFWKFPNIFVDEAQDTNPARRALIRAMLSKGGRVVAVGDRHQAIYGFTGADNDSLDLIAQDFAAIRLPLTVTYRCPKAVVEFAKQWVSHIEAHETAPEGSVASVAYAELFNRADLDASSAILCRNTKPLVKLAFELIRKKIACKVEGREIGGSIIKLARRWKVSTLNALEAKLDVYLARETAKLSSKKQEAKLQSVEDMVETVKVIIDQCRIENKHTLADLVAHVENLFSDKVTGVLVLSTIHKSKGREWNNVFWLDRANTCPSKWARQAWQIDQETNLCYVAATRAQKSLIEITVSK
jgi:DNA helicase II / ATP-dependent DNA helicase PcrA